MAGGLGVGGLHNLNRQNTVPLCTSIGTPRSDGGQVESPLVFLFCLMKNPLLYWSARPESGREGREVFKIAPLARTQSERAPSACVGKRFSAPQPTEKPATQKSAIV